MSRIQLPLLLAILLVPSAVSRPAEDVETLARELEENPEAADPEVVRKLAAIGTREAALALIGAFDQVRTLYLRLAVVDGLTKFDGVAEAEQPCLQKLMDVGTTSTDRELREAAIDGIGKYPSLGKSFLAMIVESEADTEVRERALRRHVELGDESDHEFYERIFDTNSKQAKMRAKRDKKRDKRKGEEQIDANKLDMLRAVAFEAMAPSLDDSAVLEVLEKDSFPRLRGLALRELERRQYSRLAAVAEETLENVMERADNRVTAAEVLAKLKGDKEARDFLDLGPKEPSVTPAELSRALADMLNEFRDAKTDKRLGQMVAKGKPYEKVFALWATRGIEDDKLAKNVRKQLADKSPEVRVAASLVLAERGDEGALPALTELLTSKEEEVVSAAMDAISKLREKDPAWRTELVTYAGSGSTLIRNAAITQLGHTEDKAHLDLLTKALSNPDWSTRLAALYALEELRVKEAVGPIIEQMKAEKGRILHEFADVLFNLTGQPFRTAQGSWENWWKKEGASFEIISSDELRKRTQEEEERRLKRISNVKFFGIRIISERVIFIIDVSGSMAEPTVSEGDAVTRMDVARRELKKALDGLDPKALFNIITFSGDVSSWLDEGVAGAEKKTREEAKEFVDRLGALGATNLYDAIRTAFTDPDVDTIFLLSDGEPTAGAETDPWRIREDVKLWNEHRKIEINTIAVGGELQILEWLAEDSGGSHVKFW